METLILGWYVLVENPFVFMLTLFASLLYVGTLLSPMFGVMGDRIGHRNLLSLMRSVYATCAMTLMTFAFLGILVPELVLAVTAVVGLVRPSDNGMRSALVGETMAVRPAGRRNGPSSAPPRTPRVSPARSPVRGWWQRSAWGRPISWSPPSTSSAFC